MHLDLSVFSQTSFWVLLFSLNIQRDETVLLIFLYLSATYCCNIGSYFMFGKTSGSCVPKHNKWLYWILTYAVRKNILLRWINKEAPIVRAGKEWCLIWCH